MPHVLTETELKDGVRNVLNLSPKEICDAEINEIFLSMAEDGEQINFSDFECFITANRDKVRINVIFLVWVCWIIVTVVLHFFSFYAQINHICRKTIMGFLSTAINQQTESITELSTFGTQMLRLSGLKNLEKNVCRVLFTRTFCGAATCKVCCGRHSPSTLTLLSRDRCAQWA